MLLSIDDHTKLLTIPWTRFDNTISTINTGDSNITGPLYIKTLFDQDTYRVLVTDLHYVWYELGDAPSITKTAASHRLEITCKEQVNILITSIRRCFLHSENCHVRLIPSGQLLIDYKETNKGFSSLSWTFHCTPLDTVLVSGDNHGYLDGPTVLYKHFISPLVALNQSNWLNTKVIYID
ncbi:hypothetical protein BC941DRAFT_410289 [Chlamydoabsidia padenii]|nr:hypothetical protein BC941DRAFT_410289 [Chlamydoabsidia padenii]